MLEYLIQGQWVTRDAAVKLLVRKYGWRHMSVDPVLVAMRGVKGATRTVSL